MRLQFQYIFVAVFNLLYNIIPFFYLKKILLKFANIKIGSKSYIHRKVRFFKIGNISIGNNSTVNFNCYLDNRMPIYIGNNVGIAHDTKIYTLGHDVNDPYFKAIGKPVAIKDNVFVFSNVLIMPGVTINEGAIVLSGSVVTKDVAEYTIVGGNPAKFIKSRNRSIKYCRDYGYWFAN